MISRCNEQRQAVLHDWAAGPNQEKTRIARSAWPLAASSGEQTGGSWTFDAGFSFVLLSHNY